MSLGIKKLPPLNLKHLEAVHLSAPTQTSQPPRLFSKPFVDSKAFGVVEIRGETQNGPKPSHTDQIFIPDSMVKIIFTYIDSSPSTLIRFSQLSKCYYAHCRQNSFWCGFIKKETLQDKSLHQEALNRAMELFKEPKNRLDKYVPLDKTGLKYLEALGITNKKIIQYIEDSEATIEFACLTDL